jgi:hypothetical protein
MSTARQVVVYNAHKRVCARFGVTQSTLKHKSLQGSLATASATGNRVYSGAGPTTTGPVTTNTLVWMVTTPKIPVRARPGDDTMIGRQGLPVLAAQFPAIDDNGNQVIVAHDDLITDMAGITYRISDPTITPENSLWSFLLHKER